MDRNRYTNSLLGLDANMQVYVTSDHGNTDAIGIGRPNIGETTELRGERVRVYRSDLLRSNAFLEVPTAIQLPLGSLPADYRPMFAPTGAAFVAKDHHVVAHGGASIEECLVPFVGISYK